LLSIKAHLHQNVLFLSTEGLWYHAMKLSQSSLLQFFPPFCLFKIFFLAGDWNMVIFGGIFWEKKEYAF
jgi:hypothetical protein